MEIFIPHKTVSLIRSSYSKATAFVSFNLLLIINLVVSGMMITKSRGESTGTVGGIYVFGDSLVDVGNNNYLPLSLLRANLPYNGIDYQDKKPTGRFSNGRNAADFIAEKLELPTAPPYLRRRDNELYLKGVSFASGGAGILNTTNENLIKQTIPMPLQVNQFGRVREGLLKQMGDAGVQEHLSKSLFPIVFGSNDILRYFSEGSEQSKEYLPQQYVDLMVSTLKQLLKGIHGLGARKFLVVAIPPLGCAPKQRLKSKTDACDEEVNNWSKKYNDELTRMLPSLQLELGAFHYTYFDTYGVLLELIQNAAAYGFNNTKGACCGAGRLRAELPCTPLAVFCLNRSAHIFWDIFHPTEAAAHAAIDILFRGSGNYVFPMTIQQLIAL
ncbi:GDSL esterase/lipase At5g55050 [Andrographis paniculata]|uniref:GDSL esterase/lipase At5g55050 n=1 Tax=Andrographis paniculata TaxID=175694 RepID=UPI0021E756CF|nr:GDSL esterase/lipase At5g55050 [Andrographis paniculata]